MGKRVNIDNELYWFTYSYKVDMISGSLYHCVTKYVEGRNDIRIRITNWLLEKEMKANGR